MAILHKNTRDEAFSRSFEEIDTWTLPFADFYYCLS
jgi:hypothetical protein